MKAKSMHYSKTETGNVEVLAGEIGTVYKCVADQIPPAYPCEGEKVVFIGIEGKGIDRQVTDFCRDFTPERVKNVAFYLVGAADDSHLSHIKEILKKNGINIAGDTLIIPVKNSLFKKGKVTDADIKKVLDWAGDIVENKLV